MKLSSDQREALDIILSIGEFETLCEHIEFLIECERGIPREEVEKLSKEMWEISQRDDMVIKCAGFIQGFARKLDALLAAHRVEQPSERGGREGG